MPLHLNGVYWRVSELKKATGLTTGQIYKICHDNKQSLVSYGRYFLIPDKMAKQIIKQYKPVNQRTIAITNFAKKLGCSLGIINKFVENGLPVVNNGNKQRIEHDVYELMAKILEDYIKEYDCIPTYFIPEIMEKFHQEYTKANK